VTILAQVIVKGTMTTRKSNICSSLFLVALFGVRTACAEPCTLCADGSSGDPISITDPISCAALADEATDLELDDTVCIKNQLLAYELCGCPTPPLTPAVSMVPSTPPSLSAEPSSKPSMLPSLSAEPSVLPSVLPSLSVEPSQSPSLSTEPTQIVCTICPDGSDLPFPNRTIIEDFISPGSTTCKEMEENNNITCKSRRRYASYCGCPNVEPPCTICPDGSAVPEPNLIIPFPDLANITCGMYDLLVTQVFDSDKCDEYQTMLAAFCGCLDIEPECLTMCADGSFLAQEYIHVPLFVEDGKNVTCGDMQLRVNAGDFAQPDCSNAFYMGEFGCGCTPQEAACSICEKGTILPDLTLEALSPFQCSELAGFAFGISKFDQQCVAAQGVDGVYCGCDNPVASDKICRICGEDNLLVDPNRVITFRDQKISCGNLEYSSNVLDIFCEFPTEETSACCVPETMSPAPSQSPSEAPPSPTCLLCGNMTAPAFVGVEMFLPGLGTFNCSELYKQGLNGKIKEGNCPLIQLIAAKPCGCHMESLAPTHSPSISQFPSSQPSDYPSGSPSSLPTAIPSVYPTELPSFMPSEPQPTTAPSDACHAFHSLLMPVALITVWEVISRIF